MEQVRFPLISFALFIVFIAMASYVVFFASPNVSMGAGEETNCTDEVDNDNDSFVDCNDSDCESDPACDDEFECTDEIDNDNDSFVDCNDSDCENDPECQ